MRQSIFLSPEVICARAAMVHIANFADLFEQRLKVTMAKLFKFQHRNAAWTAVLCMYLALATGAIGAESANKVSGAKPEDYRKFALLHEGDLDRGKQLFADEQKLACGKCHSTDGSASKAGPDLFAIGDKYGRREIIDSILTPSATIAVGYETTIIKTRDDQEYTGVIKDSSPDFLVLIGADGKAVRVATTNVAVRQASELSLMPDGLQTSLSVQE